MMVTIGVVFIHNTLSAAGAKILTASRSDPIASGG
jgi:hypothetical protein